MIVVEVFGSKTIAYVRVNLFFFIKERKKFKENFFFQLFLNPLILKFLRSFSYLCPYILLSNIIGNNISHRSRYLASSIYSSASEFVTLTGPYRNVLTVPYRFVTYHFREPFRSKKRTVFRLFTKSANRNEPKNVHFSVFT